MSLQNPSVYTKQQQKKAQITELMLYLANFVHKTQYIFSKWDREII